MVVLQLPRVVRQQAAEPRLVQRAVGQPLQPDLLEALPELKQQLKQQEQQEHHQQQPLERQGQEQLERQKQQERQELPLRVQPVVAQPELQGLLQQEQLVELQREHQKQQEQPFVLQQHQ